MLNVRITFVREGEAIDRAEVVVGEAPLVGDFILVGPSPNARERWYEVLQRAWRPVPDSPALGLHVVVERAERDPLV